MIFAVIKNSMKTCCTNNVTVTWKNLKLEAYRCVHGKSIESPFISWTEVYGCNLRFFSAAEQRPLTLSNRHLSWANLYTYSVAQHRIWAVLMRYHQILCIYPPYTYKTSSPVIAQLSACNPSEYLSSPICIAQRQSPRLVFIWCLGWILIYVNNMMPNTNANTTNIKQIGNLILYWLGCNSQHTQQPDLHIQSSGRKSV